MRKFQVTLNPYPIYPEEKIERSEFAVKKEEDVIGRLSYIRLVKGDTLPDVARHFGLGGNALSAANPEVDVWAPEEGERILLPTSHILPDAVKKGIVINLASMRLFFFQENKKSIAVSTYPIGIGTTERPTPTGQMRVAKKVTRPTWYVPPAIAEAHLKKGDPLPPAVLPGPDNPLGEFALYLSIPTYLIHGTNKPASIGLRATNGCIRLYPENIKALFEKTPVNTPVNIINQPYLIGRKKGVIYLEAHAPMEETDKYELEKTYTKLREIENKYKLSLDWGKVKETIDEARGIPVPLFAIDPESEELKAENIELTRPAKLYGQPEIPEMKLEAWYVLAESLHDETDALRLAAIINHQGPQIPSRVLPKDNIYHVIAGPFNEVTQAEDAVKRLKIDLELEGILIEPPRK